MILQLSYCKLNFKMANTSLYLRAGEHRKAKLILNWRVL